MTLLPPQVAIEVAPRVFELEVTGARGPGGGIGPTGSGTATVATRSALAAIASPVNNETRFLVENGRQGLFKFSTADLSAVVAADPEQGVYVAPAAATSGASGAWVRQTLDEPLPISWFGSGADDYADAIAAASFAAEVGTSWIKAPARVVTVGSAGTFAAADPYNDDWLSFAPGVYLDATGAKLRATDPVDPLWAGLRGLDYRGVFTGAKNNVTAAVDAGDNVVSITDASLIPVGSWVLFRFGDVPYDTPETYNHGLALVTARNTTSDTITLDRYLDEPFTSGQLSAAVHNKHVQPVEPLIGINFGDVVFDDDFSGGWSGAEHAVVVKQAINCEYGNVGGRGLHIGAFIAQYCYNLSVRRVFNFGSRNTSPDTGNGSRFAEVRGLRIAEHITKDCDRHAIIMEGGSTATIGYLEDDHNGELISGGARAVVSLNGRSVLEVGKATMLGLGGQMLVNPLDDSRFSSRLVEVRTATMPAYIGRMGEEIGEVLSLKIGTDDEQLFRASRGFWREFRVPLRNGASTELTIAPKHHIVADSEVYASSGVTAGLSFVNVFRAGGTKVEELAGQVVAGAWSRDAGNWKIGSGEFNDGDEHNLPLKLYVEAAAAGGGVPDLTDDFVIVRVFLVPDELAATGDTQAAADALDASGVRYGLAAVDVPSIATGASYSFDVTVTGVTLGNWFAEVTPSADPGAVGLSAFVKANDTVRVTLTNGSGGAIDPASMTFFVRASRR